MRTICQLIGSAQTRVIGWVNYEGTKFRLRLHKSDDGIRPQLKNPATNTWFFLCGTIQPSFTLEGLSIWLNVRYLCEEATITFDRHVRDGE